MHLTEFYLNNNWIHDTETYRKVLQNIQCQSMTYCSNLVRPCHDSTVFENLATVGDGLASELP